MKYRFSGHNKFHCKQQWLLKGFNNQNFTDTANSIITLGVGKNMVSSVKFWLEAFDITEKNKLTDFSHLIFSTEKGLDPYLENEGTLWLLQYKLCSKKYATIFHILFSEYFEDKVNYDFSESNVIKYLSNRLESKGEKPISENTLISDFMVLIRTYCLSNELKNIEEKFDAPLLELNLIDKKGNHKYTINKIHRSIPLHILGYCILDSFKDDSNASIRLESIRKTIGNYFCITNECLEDLLSQLQDISNVFVYTDYAGIATLDIKNNSLELRNKLLKEFYNAN